MSSGRLWFTIPARNACATEPILVILFGKLFRDETKREQMCRVADARSRFVLTGSNRFWPAYVFIHDIQDDIFDNSGTLTDIYEIAATAKDCGWEALMFVDELSWRQHTGTVTNFEDPTLSAAVVNLVCAQSETVRSPQSTFYIRRLPIVIALAECYIAEPQKPKDWAQLCPHSKNHAFQLHLHTGFYLYDPHKPIFSDSPEKDLGGLQRRTLEKDPPLPEEVKHHILTYVRQDQPTSLQELIDTGTTPGSCSARVSALIQPLIHLNDDELASVYNTITSKIWTHEFSLGRWKRSSPASRRDFSRIIRHFVGSSAEIIFVLRRPTPGQNLDTAVYSPPGSSAESFKFGIIRRESPESLCNWWHVSEHHGIRNAKVSQFDTQSEVCMDPMWSFPPSLPFWYKTLPLGEISREQDQGHLNPSCMRLRKYLACYLTSSLTDEERRVVEDLVEEDDDLDVGFTYIPWQNSTDGGPEDMLRLMKMAKYASKIGFSAESYDSLVFIDHQSPKNRQVIVCTWHLVLDHGHSGINYGRLGSDVAKVLANVPGSMGINDWIPEHELQFFPDPDYSGPLDNDDNSEI